MQISLALSVPVVALSMVPPLQFPTWQWLALILASPVVIWGARPFHRATFTNARHGAVTMDTLISMGVGAAYLWSLWAAVPRRCRGFWGADGVHPASGLIGPRAAHLP